MPDTGSAIKAIKKHVANFKRGKEYTEREIERLQRQLKQQEQWIAAAEETLKQLERDKIGN
jgi:hypothetical protein